MNNVEPMESNLTVMSVSLNKSRIGISIYKSEEKTIEVCEFWDEEPYFEYLRMLIFQYVPSFVVTTTSMPEDVLKVIQSIESTTLKLVKSSNFSYDKAKDLLTQMKLPIYTSLDEEATYEERLLKLSSFVKLEQTQAIRSMGGLLQFLSSVDSLGEGDLIIEDIIAFEIEGTLLVDAVTLESLQIFKSENHPSSHNIGPDKEGISLFRLLDKTVSTCGRKLMRQWVSRPITDRKKLFERHHSTSLFYSMDQSLIKELKASIKGVGNIPYISSKIKTGTATVKDWEIIARTIHSALNIKKFYREHNLEECYLFSDIMQFNDSILEFKNAIVSTIDFAGSKGELNICILKGVDNELDTLRRINNDLDGFLHKVALEEMRKDPSLKNIRFVYTPQIGFQMSMAVDMVSSPLERDSNDLKEYELLYQNETDAYFRTGTTRELDRLFGDIHNRILDLEATVMKNLYEYILMAFDELIRMTQIISALDCLVALACAAHEHHFIKPDMTEENVLLIQDGRHPLQELCLNGKPFIPNDILMSKQEGNIKIVTGPNFSGKSIFLKQVALIVYMAHVGSYVPASEATIGIVKRIISLGYGNTILESHKGSFLRDLEQVKHVFSPRIPNTLIILDEFGRGTSHLDGTSLLAATINNFSMCEDSDIMALISTHMFEIFEPSILFESTQNNIEHLTMDVLIPEDDKDENPIFLYKVKKGRASSSLGVYCGKLAGIPRHILERTQYISSKLASSLPIEPIPISWIKSSNGTLDAEQIDSILQSFLTFDFKMESLDRFLEECVGKEE